MPSRARRPTYCEDADLPKGANPWIKNVKEEDVINPLADANNESKDTKEISKNNESNRRPPSPASAAPSILPSLSISGDIEDNDLVIVSVTSNSVNSSSTVVGNSSEVFSPFSMPVNTNSSAAPVSQASRTAAMRDHMNKRMSFKTDENMHLSDEDSS